MQGEGCTERNLTSLVRHKMALEGIDVVVGFFLRHSRCVVTPVATSLSGHPRCVVTPVAALFRSSKWFRRRSPVNSEQNYDVTPIVYIIREHVSPQRLHDQIICIVL